MNPSLRRIACGDIGEGQREWQFEPLEQPTTTPTREPAPVEPAAPERQPEPVPA